MRNMSFLAGVNRNLGVTRTGLIPFSARWLAFLCLLAAGVLIVRGPAEAATLIPRSDANWRWRPGTNEASAPVTAWRVAGFNDSQFTTAPAPFWYDTGGDSSTLVGGTQITGMQNVYTSLFLRATFVLANTNEIAALKVGALVDDGFVAWINGVEVLRVGVPGVPGDPVSITTLANNAAEPVPFVIYTLTNPVSASYLVTGTNVLAVQVFQSTSAASSDFDFDASLESITTETNPPTILSVNPAAGTVSNLTQITVTFSEPVSGVVAPHLLVGGIGAVGVIPVNSATYTFSFAQPPYGSVPITWVSAHTIFDQAVPPNRFDAAGPGATWSYTLVDNTPPTVAGLSPGASTTVRTFSSITVLFSEPVSGVGAGDLLIGGSPASGITPTSASQYVFTFSPPPTGSVQVAWAMGHGIIDQAGNPFAGGTWSYIFDPNATDGSPYISEFMASNTRTNAQNPFSYDWIEIYNPSPLVVNLDGWSLTDSEGNLDKWRFPATNLAAGGFLVVFASGNDERIPGRQLHTSFQINSSGEYLALVNPAGMVVSEFPMPYAQQVPDVSYGFTQTPAGNTLEAGTNRVYFTTPTPGAANLGGTAVPGPIIDSVKHTPNVPLDQEDLVVTARVQPSFQAVSTVTLRYRIMYSNELSTPMLDDGAHGDGAAGDGVYGATIPASLSTNGQMIRYLVAATDVNAGASRWPLFTNPTNTAEYLGTIVSPTNVTSLLPIFHLFAAPGVLQTAPPTTQTGADGEAGGRFSIFYDGEFYDNAYMELRGNTSAGQNKKSHRVEFNREHRFRHLPGFPRVHKTSFMAEFLDPAYLRQHLSFWLLEQMGAKTPFFYPVRAQLNGQFYALIFHNDVIGQEQVERMGYDPKGALYKAAGNVLISRSSTGVFQKLEPDGPPDYTDYNQLCNGIVESATVANRRAAVFDLMDVPEVINHLAGARWCAENDDVWANMSIYRDTYGDQLWRIIPFDMNASWGQRYGGITPLDAIADTCKSHPLYGCSTIIACDGGTYNRIYDVIIALPETRQMLLRRMRTVLDRWVMEPGVPAQSRLLETHISYMTNLIGPEAVLDRAKWGYSTWTASNKPLGTAIPELFNEFINLRRIHFSGTHSVTNVAKPIGIAPTSNAGIPLAQPPQPSILIGAFESNPANSNQLQEYICLTNPNPYAVDITGWKLSGGARFTFQPGTVMSSNSVIYVSPNVLAFKQRTTGPRGGQGLFVVGPYDGQLNARGESLALNDDTGFLITSNSFIGVPTPAQLYLRVTEIMYNPSPLAGNTNDPQAFEYLELKNISGSVTLNLGGVRLTNGVDFNFTGSAVTSLAPGASVLVVRNTNAFAARYGALPNVAGQFVGALDSNGEIIRLDDAMGEKVLEFDFNNTWYPITDGYGFSLVIVDENAPWDTWGMKASWRSSGALQGSPGVVDPPSVIAGILVNEVLTHSDLPLVDRVELWNPTASPVNIGGWLLTDDVTNAHKYRFPDPTTIAAGGYLSVDEGQFNTPTNAPGSFAFGSDGDEVFLFSADPATTNLTGYLQGFDFGAAETGISFGRYTNSQTNVHFVAQSVTTFGAQNALPKVGPLVLGEVMYRPPEVTAGVDNSDDEFIEVLNITGSPVPLFDLANPSNTWHLRSAVDFDFPTNLTLAANASAMVVGFNPTNTAAVTAFRAKFSVPGGVPVLGPWSGKLDNSADSIRLYKPDAPVLGVAPYVLVDRVDYSDAAPWPAAADGLGGSLQRIVQSGYGNDVTNWVGAAPTGGGAFVPGTPPTITAQPSGTTVPAGNNVTFSVSVSGTPPFAYQWQLNGNNLPGANSSVLLLNNVQLNNAGTYRVVVLGAGGSDVSANAVLNVFLPATITQQPANQFFSVPPDPRTPPAGAASRVATFRVVVSSLNPPLTYQWRVSGTNLVPGASLVPGADTNITGITTDTLTISNVVMAHAGWYSCAITDTRGTVVSSAAVVGVKPYLVGPPVSQIIANGSPISVSASIQAFPPPYLFQWKRGNSLIGVETYSQTTTAFATFSSRTTGFTNSTGSFSNAFNLRLNVTNLATTTTGDVMTNYPTFAPGTNNIFVMADTDGDGIPNYIEAALGLDTNNLADGLLDLDLDGLSNADEYRAGTEINNSTNVLRISLTNVLGSAMLSFDAVSNRTYSIQFADAFSNAIPPAAWSRLADVPHWTNNRTLMIPDPAWTSNRFYRVVTPRAP